MKALRPRARHPPLGRAASSPTPSLVPFLPSLVQHDNLPSLLGNPQAPAGIPRSSRTYDDKPARETVGEILARQNLLRIDLDTPSVKR